MAKKFTGYRGHAFAEAMACECNRLRDTLQARLHDAVIRVCDTAGNVIHTHEETADFKGRSTNFAAR